MGSQILNKCVLICFAKINKSKISEVQTYELIEDLYSKWNFSAIDDFVSFSYRPPNFTCSHGYKTQKFLLFALCGTGCEAAYHQMALLVREPVYHDPRIGCSLTHFLQLDTDGSCMWAPHCALRPFSFCLVYLCFSTFFNLVFQKGAEFHRKLQTRFLCVAVQKAELSLCVFQNIIKWRKFFSRKLL